nr:hypothetical protein [Serratia ureilytica]
MSRVVQAGDSRCRFILAVGAIGNTLPGKPVVTHNDQLAALLPGKTERAAAKTKK